MGFTRTLIPATVLAFTTVAAAAQERPFVGGYLAESSSN